MNKFYSVIILTFTILFTQNVIAEPQLWTQQIDHTNINLDSAYATVLGQINITLPSSGKVEVRFNGMCSSDMGDLIVLAASDIPDWQTNDGNLGAFAKDSNNTSTSFSHSRVYSVAAGPQTFYAVGQNYVCTNGSGSASVYGLLSVIFFPDSDAALVEHIGFDTAANVRGNPVVIKEITINPTVPGIAVVRWDGSCAPDEGDLILLGLSPDSNFSTINTMVETKSASVCLNDIAFSTTNVFNIQAGSNTFYAIAQNDIEMDGSGDIYLATSLTVEFYPSNGNTAINMIPVFESAADLNTGLLNLGDNTIFTPSPGKVLVTFEGYCKSDTTDLITLAASDTTSWSINSGRIQIMANDSDINETCFSHSMVFPVTSSTQPYYAVAERSFPSNGNGIIDVYATLIAIYFPEMNTFVPSLQSGGGISIFPNPASRDVNISIQNSTGGKLSMKIYDATGRLINIITDGYISEGKFDYHWETNNKPSGVYFLRVENESGASTHKHIIN